MKEMKETKETIEMNVVVLDSKTQFSNLHFQETLFSQHSRVSKLVKLV